MDEMAPAPPELTVEVARFFWTYDPEAGTLRWRVPLGHASVGDLAGSLSSKSYPSVKLFGRRYSCHRLAWFIHYGVWPSQLDHINGDRGDFRLVNLREVNDSQNRMNSKRYANNSSGFKGVYFHRAREKWAASIAADGKSTFLGYFDTAKLAGDAYDLAATRLHGIHARTNKELTS